MNNLQQEIAELNLLGSSISKNDSFQSFDNSLKEYISLVKKTDYVDEYSTSSIYELVKKNLMSQLGSFEPIVLLSGGIDSTLLALILKSQNIDFKCFSYFLNKSDPSYYNVLEVEKIMGIKSSHIFYNQDDVKSIWQSYYQYYLSPNMDYGTLLMADFISKIKHHLHDPDNYVFIDGVGADDIFGCSSYLRINRLKSFFFTLLSQSPFKYYQFQNGKLNLYSSSLIKNRFANLLYQNYIFSKIINPKYFDEICDYMNLLIPDVKNKSGSYNSKSALLNLYFDGRRVAYKSYGLFSNTNNKVIYPYLNLDVIQYGFSLKTSLKIEPHFKEPLKKLLLEKGFSKEFVYAKKVGFGYDIFETIDKEEIFDQLNVLEKLFELKIKSPNYLYNQFKNRSKSTDHFLFGLAMSIAHIKKYSER